MSIITIAHGAYSGGNAIADYRRPRLSVTNPSIGRC